MRALYVVLGLLGGVYYVSALMGPVIDQREQAISQMWTGVLLTGYYEGMSRGQERAEAKYAHYLSQCYDELSRKTN